MFRTPAGSTAEGTDHLDPAAVLESFPANIAYVGSDLVYRFVNSNYETTFGRPSRDIVGRHVAEVLGPQGYAVAEARLRRVLAGEAQNYESEFRFPGRPAIWLVVYYIPDRDADDHVRGFFVVSIDVTRRHRAEHDLLDAATRHRVLYEQAPICISYYDRECRLLEMNQRAADLLGTAADDACGRTLVEVLGDELGAEFLQRQREVLVDGRSREHVDEVELETGPRWFLSSFAPVPGADGAPCGLQIVSSDITELKRAEQAQREVEEKLRQTQKLQAIGLLAGGVAHDFNNILQTVLSFTGEMMDDPAVASHHREDVGVVRDACRRGASLTAQLLAFSRQQHLSPQALDAHDSITSVFKMIRRLIGEDIELVLDLGAARSRLRVDEGQLAQVLLNLAVNARDAMLGGGRLTVSTSERRLDAGAHPELPAGEYLVIGVRDTGCGIAPEVIDRVFEPFFTTKEVGHGSGLGLATVFGIVRQHGGLVEVASSAGAGSLFEVLLPLLADAPDADAAQPAAGRPGGSETILLAEDDADVRVLLCRGLRRAGYRVLEAADGDQAVALLEAHPGVVDLAVLDVVMPRRSGREAWAAMRERQPDLAVLFLSGYPLDHDGNQPGWDPALPLLRKPIAGDELCRQVRRCLNLARADVAPGQ
ncbi:MAG: PAS domain-containing protein [bacterium]|nr:PAS domain-containing protein [bacterium]